jgi:hypothetical protein
VTDNPVQNPTRKPERGPSFKSCPKCEAVEDVALLCGPCADRFADHLMADPAFAATMAAWEAMNLPGDASDGR